jgi:hypothetical protein
MGEPTMTKVEKLDDLTDKIRALVKGSDVVLALAALQIVDEELRGTITTMEDAFALPQRVENFRHWALSVK